MLLGGGDRDWEEAEDALNGLCPKRRQDPVRKGFARDRDMIMSLFCSHRAALKPQSLNALPQSRCCTGSLRPEEAGRVSMQVQYWEPAS